MAFREAKAKEKNSLIIVLVAFLLLTLIFSLKETVSRIL